jgi:hypothetical protein
VLQIPQERRMFQIIKTYLENAAESFDNDPPDTDFQEGYRAAILDVLEFIEDYE